MASYLNSFMSALAPKRCIACDLLCFDQDFCVSCLESVAQIESQYEPQMGAFGFFKYQGALSEAIRRAKFDPDETKARTLLSFLTLGCEHIDRLNVAFGTGVDAVTFVPLHWRRRLKRRFDFAAIIAVFVAKMIRRPVVDALVCARYESALSLSSSSEERKAKVKDRYVMRIKMPARLRILLVDDIMTTGFTLEAAAAPLLQHDLVVSKLVLAITPRHN